ncbi:MAG: DNA repair protein RecO [Candidatus Buchananbacteria bacterium]
MATYQTYGIILKKTDRGEADQLFSIYTQTHGKILALGRATKKSQSKLNCHLQSFVVVNLMIAFGKSNDHIASAEIFKNFSSLSKDLKKIFLASFGLELIEKLTKLGQPDPKIFSLLARYLWVIDKNNFSDSDWYLIKKTFTLKLLTLLGLEPKADIAANPKKLDWFLKQLLEDELQTEKFLNKIRPAVLSI